MKSEFWIEKGWGDFIDNATFKDVKKTIKEVKNMDDEHGAFWIGNMENEYTLEVHKSLRLFFVYGENQNKQLKILAENWNIIGDYFSLYMNGDFEKIKAQMIANSTCEKLIIRD